MKAWSSLLLLLGCVAAACGAPASSDATQRTPAPEAGAGAPPDAHAATKDAGDADAACGREAEVVPEDGRGPDMVDIGPLCIDTTPVTARQYAAFLTAAVAPSGAQAAECAWNDSFAPAALPACNLAYRPETAPNRPVVCVDWCDAAAFCKWSGKRLCGRVGGAMVPYGKYDVRNKEYDFACSNGGATAYSYGVAYDANACTAVSDVGSSPTCRSRVPPFRDVVDLSGNVFEWVDDCDVTSGRADNCIQRGASDGATSETARCDWVVAEARGTDIGYLTGFRCCAD